MALSETDLKNLPNDGQGVDPENPGEYKILLGDLQGNILTGHGRDHAVHLFIKFKSGKEADAKTWVQTFGRKYVTSAQLQSDEACQYRDNEIGGSVFTNFFLSIKGYEYFGIAPYQMPGSQPFRYGMKNESVKNYLGDPPVDTWDVGLQQEIHALILMADDEIVELLQDVNKVSQSLFQVAEIVQREDGFILRNSNNKPIEHFGFADGVSQPLFLKRAIDNARQYEGNFDKWDPRAPLGLVLEKDRTGKTDDSYGSYLVYRKLEQDVKGFREDRQALATTVGVGYDLAGALTVGRFEDGTPVVDSKTPEGSTSTNNFNYADDPAEFGLDPKPTKCPFHAHIRKTNPRGDTGRVNSSTDFDKSLEVERSHRIARRGISYGERDLNQNPQVGSGLLFLCFQANLENQFNFMQGGWANQNNFVAVNVGLDPIIGQPAGTKGNQTWPQTWGDANTQEVDYDFTTWVKLKGGEYFFTPSLSSLRTIADRALPIDLSTSLEFDGQTGHITLDDDRVFDLTNSFTLEAWVKFSSESQLSGVQRIFAKPDAYGFGLNGKRIRFTTYNHKDYDTTEVTALGDGKWHHLAVVLDGNNHASFYVDGQFLEGITGNTPADQTSSTCQIGVGQQNHSSNLIEYWKGNLADVRLWNCIRSEQEIQDNMSCRLTGYESGLAGYWPLEHGKGSVAQDNTQNANYGLIRGNVSWDVVAGPVIPCS